MARAALPVVLCLLAACRPTPPPTPFADALFALGEEARRGLGLAVPDAALGRRELRALVERLSFARKEHGKGFVARLNATVFDELGYQRDLRRDQLEPTLLSAVLTRRVGSCTGLGGLYLALGEALGKPLRGVLLPGHFTVRLANGAARPIEIELLRRGRQMPAEWYRARYAIPPAARDYGRPLSPQESLAVLRYNLANAYARAGQVDRALSIYRQVVSRLPGFAEAQLQLGRLLAARGDTPGASAAFAAARAANPALRAPELQPR